MLPEWVIMGGDGENWEYCRGTAPPSNYNSGKWSTPLTPDYPSLNT